MGMGPVPAVKKVLQRAGVGLNEVDLVEINEAFAVQTLAVMRELDLSEEKVNVNGGAIALGHPLGCSGARLLTTLLYEMRRRAEAAMRRRAAERSQESPEKPFYGLAALCVGVGQGEATLIEWLG
jgi:acetyl-CoA acetyltransferase